MNWYSVKIGKSDRNNKKLKALFENKDKTKHKTVHFGASGYDDYTIHKNDRRKELYIKRHKTRENWNQPDNPGSLSRWILWEEKSRDKAIRMFKKRFNLK